VASGYASKARMGRQSRWLWHHWRLCCLSFTASAITPQLGDIRRDPPRLVFGDGLCLKNQAPLLFAAAHYRS
jgi:hypothetical protein